MNSSSSSRTLVIGAVSLLAVAALGWFLLISPAMGKVSATRQETENAQQRSASLSAQVATLQKQQRELPAVRKLAATLEQIIPTTADQPGFFAAVNRAARQAGIAPGHVKTLSPTAPQVLDANGQPVDTSAAVPAAPAASGTSTVGDVAEQTVAVIVDADEAQTERLLQNLETMPRAFVVQSLEISTGGSEGDNSSTLTVSISGTTYVAPPMTQPGPAKGGSSNSAG